MHEFCDNPYCENPGTKEVPASVERPSDQKRTLCTPCEEAYAWGVQHGTMMAQHAVGFGKPTHMRVDERELATILAALRFHQDENLQGGAGIPDEAIKDIASDGSRFQPLTFDEVNQLCERFNVTQGRIDWRTCEHDWQDAHGPKTGCETEYWFRCSRCGATKYRCVDQDGSANKEIHPPNEEAEALPEARPEPPAVQPAPKGVSPLAGPESLGLVKVCWGEDTGLVSLALQVTLCYAWDVARNAFSAPRGTPVVEITDEEMDTAFADEPTWDDVPRFLVQRAKEYGLADLVEGSLAADRPRTEGTSP